MFGDPRHAGGVRHVILTIEPHDEHTTTQTKAICPNIFVWLDVAGVLSLRPANKQCCGNFFEHAGPAKSNTQRCDFEGSMAALLRHDGVRMCSPTRA